MTLSVVPAMSATLDYFERATVPPVASFGELFFVRSSAIRNFFSVAGTFRGATR